MRVSLFCFSSVGAAFQSVGIHIDPPQAS